MLSQVESSSPLSLSSAASGSVTTQVVDSFSAVSEAEWQDLWGRDPQATVYQSHAWYALWEKHLARGAQCRVVLARQDSRLIGACPYAILRRWREGVHRGRLLTFASSFSLAYPLDQGPLLDAEQRADALDSLARATERLGGHEMIVFELFERGSATDELLAAIGRHLRQPPQLAPQTESHLVTLRPTWDEFLEGLGARTRRNIRAYAKKFHEASPENRIDQAVDPAAMRALIGAMIEQKSRRFQQEGRKSNFDEEAFARFLDEASLALLERGMIMALAARIGEYNAATQLVLHDRHGHIYSYNSSFDPDHKELRLHYLLESERIRRAIELGYSRMDLSTGFGDHKQHWTGGQFRQLYQGHLFRNMLGRATHWAFNRLREWKRARQVGDAGSPETPDSAPATEAASPSKDRVA